MTRVEAAHEVLKILESLNDDSDLEFVLNWVNLSYPKGKRGSVSGEKSSSKKKAEKKEKSPNEEKKPSKPSSEKKPAQMKPGKPEEKNKKCFLTEVYLALSPVFGPLPKVVRDPSANQPSMDRKSVQRRLNAKRKGLMEAIESLFSNPEPEEIFDCLNSIQSFRLAARDAMVKELTGTVFLSTNPLPPNGLPEAYRNILIEMSYMLSEDHLVTEFGFFHRPSDLFDYRPVSLTGLERKGGNLSNLEATASDEELSQEEPNQAPSEKEKNAEDDESEKPKMEF
jgi:hypothetical protein